MASKLHETEVEVSVMADKEVAKDHVQFLITEKKVDPDREKMKMATDDSSASNFSFLSPGIYIYLYKDRKLD